jgi:hypothetical protein
MTDTPVEFDISVTGDGVSASESDWIPLNRWSSALARIHTSIASGSPTYSVIGTQFNVLRDGDNVPAADEIPVPDYDGVSAGKTTVQSLLFRAVKLRVSDSAAGEVRLQVQTEGTC